MRTRITPNTDTFHAVIFRTLAYSETKTYSDLSMPKNQKYIQNRDIFRILAYSELESYGEPYQRASMERFAKKVIGYNYFAKL